ncbi:MAG TPA: hypothetical protein VKC64_17660 [Burkholderiales bacterium]|nr:hypothetical protein [Burkholderiales bacterium]
MSSPASADSRDDISLVRDDPPFRWQRSIGLIPRSGGLGVGRRAVFWTALAWLPIALWAWWAGRALPEQGQTPEPLLQHFGVHARLLVGVPLLIIAEAVAQNIMIRLFPQFLHARIVRPTDMPKFRAVLARTARLRSATVPWVIIIGVALAWAFTGTVVHRAHELLWAAEGGSGPSLGFGGWWYVYVGRPIFIVLLLGWLWRLILLGVTLKGIAKLDLAIVPTHPDRAGGLGFVEKFPAAFSIVVFVIAMVIAGGWGHDAEFHSLDVHSLYPMMAAALVIALLVFLSPYLALAGPLARAKKQALLDYATMVARHGWAVRSKWILGDAKVDEPLLDAPEIGPVADTISLYEAVQRMRPIPLGRAAALAIAVPLLIPFIAVLAIQIPLKELLGGLAKGLF